ncbi:hypothetical protein CMO88_01475 [Candidatus Woesearchaeota archaeon]|nr:hypothetical protein [Candidatus Woesearchaeota archaeon]|tara:strand:- start:38385 stop:38570 length:186 start_codon:yes stop_codon:yes gene_type:complete
MESQGYQCNNCKYRFSPKSAEKVPKNCPYCNKPETLEQVKSAQDYLEEVSSDVQEREERQN